MNTLTVWTPQEFMHRFLVPLKDSLRLMPVHHKLISLQEFLDAPERAPDWIVAPLFCRGDKVLVYGDPGCRKSWMLLDMGLHLAAGKPWLGHFAVPKEPLKVLYIDEEMTRSLLASRIRRLCSGNALDAALPNFKALSHYRVKLKTDYLKELNRWLRERSFTPDVVIIETLRQTLEGSEKEMENIVAMWQSVDRANRGRTTTIISHHMKKPAVDSKMDVSYMASGSGYIVGGSDDAMAVETGFQDITTVNPFRVRAAAPCPPFRFQLHANLDGTGPARLEYKGRVGGMVEGEEGKGRRLMQAYVLEHQGVFQTGEAEVYLKGAATVLNVKHAEAPPHAMRHPCQHRLQIRSGFPILCPSLAMRAQRPTQLFGLIQNKDVTTLAAPRSLKTSVTSVYHVRVA